MGKMRCHYEVLDVARDADGDQIKKMYRKMALKWHPDKNQDKIEEAEVAFKEIVAAYEVLSNPQERAWYDSHREAILQGGDGTAGGDDSGAFVVTPNLWVFFRWDYYQGYQDDDNGFYTMYRKAFEEIGKVEVESGVGEKIIEGPSFGTSSSEDAVINAFYAYWSRFVSRLTFTWADLYHPGSATNRYERRAIEKENKKARAKARKEYNERVVSLVSFVRNRDKRLVEVARRKKQAEEERAKKLQAEKDEKRRLKREAAEKWREAYEKEREKHEEEARADGRTLFRLADDELSESDEDEKLIVWRCEVCSKDFKSEKQLKNHEKSKKHVAAVKKLEIQLRLEEELMKEAMDSSELSDEDDQDDDESSVVGGENVEQGPEKQHQANQDKVEETNSDSDDSDVDFAAFYNNRSRQNEDSEEGDEDEEDEEEDEQEEEQEEQADELDDGGEEVQDGGEQQSTCASNKQEEQLDGEVGVRQEVVEEEATPPPAPPVVQEERTKTDHHCVTCNTYFLSRNQLFKHIKKTNHAVPPDQIGKKKKGKKGKKGKKRG